MLLLLLRVSPEAAHCPERGLCLGGVSSNVSDGILEADGGLGEKTPGHEALLEPGVAAEMQLALRSFARASEQMEAPTALTLSITTCMGRHIRSANKRIADSK